MTLEEVNSIRIKLVAEMDGFEREVESVYDTLVLPNWKGKLHGFPGTLYGYMMLCFSRIDLFSAYWQGSERQQTLRMIAFMQKYLAVDKEICSVAVQIWRHKLMHTGSPRRLIVKDSSEVYKYLLQWGKDHLPADQHFTFSEVTDTKVLNVGLIYLLKDIRTGLEKYLIDLSTDTELQKKFEKVEREIQNSQFKTL